MASIFFLNETQFAILESAGFFSNPVTTAAIKHALSPADLFSIEDTTRSLLQPGGILNSLGLADILYDNIDGNDLVWSDQNESSKAITFRSLYEDGYILKARWGRDAIIIYMKRDDKITAGNVETDTNNMSRSLANDQRTRCLKNIVGDMFTILPFKEIKMTTPFRLALNSYLNH